MESFFDFYPHQKSTLFSVLFFFFLRFLFFFSFFSKYVQTEVYWWAFNCIRKTFNMKTIHQSILCDVPSLFFFSLSLLLLSQRQDTSIYNIFIWKHLFFFLCSMFSWKIVCSLKSWCFRKFNLTLLNFFMKQTFQRQGR